MLADGFVGGDVPVPLALLSDRRISEAAKVLYVYLALGSGGVEWRPTRPAIAAALGWSPCKVTRCKGALLDRGWLRGRRTVWGWTTYHLQEEA